MKIFARETAGARRWIAVAESSEVPEGGVAVSVLGDREIVLARESGRVYGVDAECPHRGGSFVKGRICEGTVRCPMHGYEFDLRTGRGVGNDLQAEVIQVSESEESPV